METAHTVADVHGFWSTEACGTHFVARPADEADFYRRFREHRDRVHWHLPLMMPFAAARGERVLEIGTGNGADAVRFAQHGAHYTGVDLTQTALDATRRHFEVLGLRGTFQRENAEALSLPDGSFDRVYSYGVLHHTPNTQAAIDEVWRVLRPGGEAIVMLYHRHSFNYVVRIMTYMRLRALATILARAGRWARDRRAGTGGMLGVRGNEDRRVWDIHYRNFLATGWRYLAARNFVHHATDGPECPIAHVYSRREARRLFARFEDVRFRVAYFPIRQTPRTAWIPFAVERALAPIVGWHLCIFARKPAAPAR